MLAALVKSELFGKTKIDQVYLILLGSLSDTEISWLNVPMKETSIVHVL
jgi:hypothetical protein